jgi:DNA-binding response OmpR family regulator
MSSTASGTALRVLVAEDDLEIADMLRGTLSGAGYDVTLVHDGEEALRAALAQRPDLVVLDVMMPQMNGWEVCKALRARREMAGVGILMLTAIGPNLNEMTAPLYGADDHLDKPFVITELLERLAALAEKVSVGRTAVV